MLVSLVLLNAGFTGSKYTWSNNRLRGSTIAERLDRVLYNSEWLQLLSSMVDNLNRACSDHSALLVTTTKPSSVGSNRKFINAWSTHHQSLVVVKEA